VYEPEVTFLNWMQIDDNWYSCFLQPCQWHGYKEQKQKLVQCIVYEPEIIFPRSMQTNGNFQSVVPYIRVNGTVVRNSKKTLQINELIESKRFLSNREYMFVPYNRTFGTDIRNNTIKNAIGFN
jgi:hypothetical protein